MSLLDQAKREAKRLFKLAKTHPAINNTYNLPFTNLSNSRQYIANINGYNNWHDYEENLKRKDFIQGNIDKTSLNKEEKSILLNKEYFIQDKKFIIYKNNALTQACSYEYKEAKEVILGHSIIEKSLFKEENKRSWRLDTYPVMVSGNIGSGKTESLLSIAKQYIDNNEGCIYLNAKGDNVLYTKIFSYCQQSKRFGDLHVLNYMRGSKTYEEYMATTPHKKLSNSFDPINPIIGEEAMFVDMFGKEMGIIINQIGLVAKSKNWLINFDSLEAICMLPNLINWANNNFWEQATIYIKNYLESIGYIDNAQEEDFNEIIDQHALLCQKMKSTLDTLSSCYEFQIFSINPEIDLEDIFRQRKILVVLLPYLEKSEYELSILAQVVTNQLMLFSQKSIHNNYSNLKSNHWQNIIIDDFSYCISENLSDYFSKALVCKENNWILGTQDFSYQNKKAFNNALISCNTHIIMKQEDLSLFPQYLKILIVDNIENIPPIFSKNIKTGSKHYVTFKEQSEGMAYILTNVNYNEQQKDIYKQSQWVFERIQCVYLPAPRPDYIHMNRFASKVKLEIINV